MIKTHKNRPFFNEKAWNVYSERKYTFLIRLKTHKPLNSKDILGIKLSVEFPGSGAEPEKRERFIRFGERGYYHIEKYFTILAMKYVYDAVSSESEDSKGLVTGNVFSNLREMGIWPNKAQRQSYIDVLRKWSEEKGDECFTSLFKGLFDSQTELYYLIWLGGSSTNQQDAVFQLNPEAIRKGSLIINFLIDKTKEPVTEENNYQGIDFSAIFENPKVESVKVESDEEYAAKVRFTYLLWLCSNSIDRIVREESLFNLVTETVALLRVCIPHLGKESINLIVPESVLNDPTPYTNARIKMRTIEDKKTLCIDMLTWSNKTKSCALQIAFRDDIGWFYSTNNVVNDENALKSVISILDAGSIRYAATRWSMAFIKLRGAFPEKMKPFINDFEEAVRRNKEFEKNPTATEKREPPFMIEIYKKRTRKQR